jgi:hypothetical protein
VPGTVLCKTTTFPAMRNPEHNAAAGHPPRHSDPVHLSR